MHKVVVSMQDVTQGRKEIWNQGWSGKSPLQQAVAAQSPQWVALAAVLADLLLEH